MHDIFSSFGGLTNKSAIKENVWDPDSCRDAQGCLNDPHALQAKAIAAGGTEIDPVSDYDYENRRGCIADPFGPHWLIGKKIG